MTGILGALGGMFPVTTVTVSINDQSVSDTAISPATASATYTINSDGTVRDKNAALIETWLLTGAASDFDIRATLTSGTTPTSLYGLDTWFSGSFGNEWSLLVSTNTTATCVLLVEIRNASSLVVLDSASITLTAQRTS